MHQRESQFQPQLHSHKQASNAASINKPSVNRAAARAKPAPMRRLANAVRFGLKHLRLDVSDDKANRTNSPTTEAAQLLASVGLERRQLDAFIQQGTRIPDDKIRKLYSFLRSNPSLPRDVARRLNAVLRVSQQTKHLDSQPVAPQPRRPPRASTRLSAAESKRDVEPESKQLITEIPSNPTPMIGATSSTPYSDANLPTFTSTSVSSSTTAASSDFKGPPRLFLFNFSTQDGLKAPFNDLIFLFHATVLNDGIDSDEDRVTPDAIVRFWREFDKVDSPAEIVSKFCSFAATEVALDSPHNSLVLLRCMRKLSVPWLCRGIRQYLRPVQDLRSIAQLCFRDDPECLQLVGILIERALSLREKRDQIDV